MGVGMLVDFIKSNDIQPEWMNIQLPAGMLMNVSCNTWSSLLTFAGTL